MFPLSASHLSTTKRLLFISLLVIGAFLLQYNFSRWPYNFFRPNLVPGWPRLLIYGVLVYGIWSVLMPIAIAALVAGPRRWASAIGLDGSAWVAAKLGLISTAVLPITYALIAPLSSDEILQEIILGALFPGIGEEIFYRGMLFGLLFRFAGWGFLPAALLGAVVFGIGHFYQGNSILEFLGIFGITAIAAIWWSWMYIEWDNNIWVPVGLHILMNGYFAIFDVAEGTLGSWSFFFIRAVVVLISIWLTLRHIKARGHFRIGAKDWLWRGRRAETTASLNSDTNSV